MTKEKILLRDQQLVTCEACGSNNIGYVPHYLGVVALGSCLMWFIIGIPILIYGLIMGMFSSNYFYQCKDKNCKHKQKVDKETHKKFMTTVKQ